MSHTTVIKKWKKWYPDKLNESKNIKQQLVSSNDDLDIINSSNQNKLFIPVLEKTVSMSENFDQNMLNDSSKKNVTHADGQCNMTDGLKLKEEFLNFEKEKKIFFITIKEFLHNFQLSMNTLDELISSRLEQLVLKVTEKIIESIPIIEKNIILNKINFFLNQDIFCFKKIRLHIHPDNKLLIEKEFGKIFNDYGWIIFSDSEIDKNGCKFSSLVDGSEFDCNLSSRFKALSRITFLEE
ncbi:Flagellar assembly protein FliH [Buchnera aphidicola (Eriosoma grossulariae)]|uniref:FliH/SctL family protein n=1 Tax=Buchnera aphidicola TaxID=9 RepID=UPI003463C445